MGRAKQELLEHEEKIQKAIGLCVRIGVFELCPVHDDTALDKLEYFDADELTTRVLSEIQEAEDMFDSRDEMKECLREALEQTGEECPSCAQHRGS